MTTKTLLYTGELIITRCWCGISQAIPNDLYKWAKGNPTRTVYCPLGHSWVFSGPTEAERLRQDLKWEQDARARAVAERDQAEASRRAWKGQTTRLRNRAAVGECPFCGQHLRDLARHVTRQHKDQEVRELTEADATTNIEGAGRPVQSGSDGTNGESAHRPPVASGPSPASIKWPSRDELRRMTPSEVNRFLESIGVSWRVVESALPTP